jgi:hypothetical protein
MHNHNPEQLRESVNLAVQRAVDDRMNKTHINEEKDKDGNQNLVAVYNQRNHRSLR